MFQISLQQKVLNFIQNTNRNQLSFEHRKSKYEHQLIQKLPFQNIQLHEFSSIFLVQ